MRLGVNLSLGGRNANELMEFAQQAEALGFDSLWTGEAYGGDAVTPLAFAAAHTSRIKLGTAILQIPARSAAMTAMTAISLDRLSGGRVILGLGMSGPQVVEGWHGLPYQAPLATTEDYVAIVRKIIAGDGKITHEGRRLQIPYRGPDGTGLGKAMRAGIHSRTDIPVYLAAIGPRNVALAGRIADGLLPMLWNPYRWKEAFGDALNDVDLETFDLAPTVPAAIGDDLAACRDKVRPLLGMYIGGMGAKGKNFYNDVVRRYGYESDAERIQDLYLSGDRRGALSAVPDQLIDELALVGPREHVSDQLDAWRESGATTLILSTPKLEVMRTIAELVA